MEFSWVTFLLEAINFLVLVWLLKRLFYAPVKRVIAKRQAAIEQKLQSAQQARAEADQLNLQYQERLRDWEAEKKDKREALLTELAAEKDRQLKEMETSVSAAQEKAQAHAEQNSAQRRAEEEKQAIRLALAFTSQLFRDLACPQLEEKIVDRTIAQIASSRGAFFPARASVPSGHPVRVRVRSAYPLEETQRAALDQLIRDSIGETDGVTFALDPQLIAGLEIVTDTTEIRANLRDELAFFASGETHEQL